MNGSDYKTLKIERREGYCDSFVSDFGGRGKSRQCTRKSSVKRSRKGYCRQHDPVEVKKRNEERTRKIEFEIKKKEMIYRNQEQKIEIYDQAFRDMGSADIKKAAHIGVDKLLNRYRYGE